MCALIQTAVFTHACLHLFVNSTALVALIQLLAFIEPNL